MKPVTEQFPKSDRLSPLPEVSVICTARNAERTLPKVIDSILQQSLTAWEFIIVNDGSSDGTSAILHAYAGRDSRIKILEGGAIGRGKALNLALRHCKADAVANIDADDPSHYQRLEFQVSALHDNPEFALICTDTVHIFDDDVLAQPELEYQTAATNDITQELARRNPINHSAALMQKAALERVGGYSESRTSLFDYELWIRLAAAGYKLGKLSCPLASKRIHSGQSFETKKRLAYLCGVSQLQGQAIKALGAHWSAWFMVLLKFIWGLLPQRLRIFSRTAADVRVVPR